MTQKSGIKIIRIVTIIVIISLIAFSNSFSCSCKEITSIDFVDFHSTDMIFIGKVRNIKDFDKENILITFDITKNYKGKTSNNRVEVASPKYESNCGLGIKIGQKWLIMAVLRNGTPHTHRCFKNSLSINRKYKDDSTQLENIISFKTGRIELFDLQTQNVRLAEGTLENGIPVKKWRYYYNGGMLKLEGSYNKGKRIGVWREYLADTLTNAWKEFYYKEGILIREVHYILGKLSSEIEYVNNLEVDRIKKVYSQEGKVEKLFEYKHNGTIVLTKFDKHGKIIKREEYTSQTD